jgi:hypothetical protein
MSSQELLKILFSKLDEWQSDAIVIPHGQTWGFHVPLGTSWDNRLNDQGHDSSKQILTRSDVWAW